MQVKKTFINSRFLGRRMPVATYGHFGFPLLCFPTAAENFEEFERQGMIEALSEQIESGVVKIITTDSINSESWSNKHVSVTEAARRHQAYDNYIANELVAHIYEDCNGRLPIGAMGASFGAYHAVNTVLKHPHTFSHGFGLSGVYDISHYFGSSFDDNCYQNSPVHYLPNLKGTERWEAVQQVNLTLICGQGAWERVHWTTDFSRFLDNLGFQHTLDLWGHDVAHDWPWWFKQMNHYIKKYFG